MREKKNHVENNFSYDCSCLTKTFTNCFLPFCAERFGVKWFLSKCTKLQSISTTATRYGKAFTYSSHHFTAADLSSMFSNDVLQFLGSQLIPITLDSDGLLNDLCRHGGLTNGLCPAGISTAHHDCAGNDCATILGSCDPTNQRMSAINQVSMQWFHS